MQRDSPSSPFPIARSRPWAENTSFRPQLLVARAVLDREAQRVPPARAAPYALCQWQALDRRWSPLCAGPRSAQCVTNWAWQVHCHGTLAGAGISTRPTRGPGANDPTTRARLPCQDRPPCSNAAADVGRSGMAADGPAGGDSLLESGRGRLAGTRPAHHGPTAAWWAAAPHRLRREALRGRPALLLSLPGASCSSQRRRGAALPQPRPRRVRPWAQPLRGNAGQGNQVSGPNGRTPCDIGSR